MSRSQIGKSENEIGPQKGKQEQFLSCSADIAFYGGAAGSGKTHAVLLLPLYHIHVPRFNTIIFRRTFGEITTPGGLWDEATNLYSKFGAKMRGKPEYSATFPSGAKVVFSHLEYDQDCDKHYGGQYCLICFDELITFTFYQFNFLMSRNRSTCGVRPYIRCTTNPIAGSWVGEQYLDWWIDEKGFPIEERSGVIKYFRRAEGNKIEWVDKDWRDPNDPSIGPKSFTFIPALIDDNQILMKMDPGYKASLLALPQVDRERLLKGNWLARPEDGMFDPDWFEIVDKLPAPTSPRFRYWDRANTEKSEKNKNPDATAGVLGYMAGDVFVIEDIAHFRATPAQNEAKIRRCAELDGRDTTIIIEQEPGSSGKDVVYNYQERVLKEFVVRADRPSGNKIDRAKPLSSLSERKRVILKRANWNKAFLDEAAAFPPPADGHDDIVDAASGCLNALLQDFRLLPNYNRKNIYDPKDEPQLPSMIDKSASYVIMYQEQDLKLHMSFLYWAAKTKILYLFKESVMDTPTIPMIAKTIREGCKKFVCHGNEQMFDKGQNIPYLLLSQDIRVTMNPRFNDEGAIAVANEMFKVGKIKIHKDCVEADRQIREWTRTDGKISKKRIGICKGICMVVSELRAHRMIVEQPPERGYSPKTQAEYRALQSGQMWPLHKPKGRRKERAKGSWMI